VRVIIDSPVWSFAFRRKHVVEPEILRKFNELADLNDAVLIGAVRQEVLSGISDENVFENLRQKLSRFHDHEATTFDHETAARFSNICRKNGVQGSHTDFLICAVAHNNNLIIFTTDNDFKDYARLLPIRLLR